MLGFPHPSPSFKKIILKMSQEILSSLEGKKEKHINSTFPEISARWYFLIQSPGNVLCHHTYNNMFIICGYIAR